MIGKDIKGQEDHTGGDKPDLIAFFLKSVQNGPKGRFLETAGDSSFLIVFVPRAESLGPVVEGIAEWFMNTLEGVTACHEDLQDQSASMIGKICISS